jgi:hypothetical protein
MGLMTKAEAKRLGLLDDAPAPRQRSQPEAEFTAAVIAYAQLYGWLALHIRPGMVGGRWATQVQGNGVGFPDVLLLRLKPPGKLVAELKVGRNKPTPEQMRWLQAFAGNGFPAYVFTPDDWPEIERVLGGAGGLT